ncbi:MAG TPA: FliH/SctL family protein [Candidatus Aquilonibacter sp.]|nr:FliH/SctL family protein [Candidatus Aquilonibacter sp.]
MGKVLRAARIVEQKYVVGVPVTDVPVSNGVAHDDDDAFAASFAPPSTNGHHDAEAYSGYDEPVPVAPVAPQVDWERLRADAEAIVDRAAADAESLLKQAETTALELVERAQAHAAQIEEEARTKGHDEGFALGHEAGVSEFEPVVQTLRGWIEGIREQREGVLAAAEPELVRLAMAIAERVVHTEVAKNRQVVVENVRAALTRLVTREVVTLRVNPADHETIRQYRDSLVEASDVEHLRIVEDQRVDRGGVVVETDAGTIDAKIATQLREAKRAILHDEAIALDTPQELDAFPESAAS